MPERRINLFSMGDQANNNNGDENGKKQQKNNGEKDKNQKRNWMEFIWKGMTQHNYSSNFCCSVLCGILGL